MPIIINKIVSFIAGIIVGGMISGFIGYRYNRKIIKDKSTSDFCTDAYILFNDILKKTNKGFMSPSAIILKSLPDTDGVIDAVSMKISKRKSRKLRNAYKKYKAPNPKAKSDEAKLFPYDFNEEVFEKHPQYHIKGVKNGKELAIHNINKVRNLLK